MSYLWGFVCAVPAESKEVYRDYAAKAAELFHEYGATRCVEAWEDDVPDGKQTDFRRAVDLKPGEKVVFSWIEFPSKQVADAAMQKMSEDSRMAAMGEMPFDGKRMIYGSFMPILDH